MGYQKIINLLGNTPNQLSKFRTKNWIEINDQSRGVCIMLIVTLDLKRQCFCNIHVYASSLCDYSDAYIGRIKEE